MIEVEKSISTHGYQDPHVVTSLCLFASHDIPSLDVFFSLYPYSHQLHIPIHSFHHPLIAYNFKSLEIGVCIPWESYLLFSSLHFL